MEHQHQQKITNGNGYTKVADDIYCPQIIMPNTLQIRPPFPPFTNESALEKVRVFEDTWNSRDPKFVSMNYSESNVWRHSDELVNGREPLVVFLTKKWAKERDYRTIKELERFDENQIVVKFAHEWHNDKGAWFRSSGKENWEFNKQGLMVSVTVNSDNDMPIKEDERKFRWPLGRRPYNHLSLTELGL